MVYKQKRLEIPAASSSILRLSLHLVVKPLAGFPNRFGNFRVLVVVVELMEWRLQFGFHPMQFFVGTGDTLEVVFRSEGHVPTRYSPVRR